MASLFETARIGKLELKNRLVRSATCEWSCDADGRVTPGLVPLYRTLAHGGVGLIVTGHAYVTRTGRASPGQIGIYTDSLGEALAPIAQAAHEESAKIVVQINHAGRAAAPQLNDGVEPAGFSAVPAGKGLPPPREMTSDEIGALVKAFGQAARRAQAAGFDGVQVHAAHGYLISQSLSPATNQRADRWGGSFDNRLTFLRAVCEEVRGQVGADFPMFIKLASEDFVDGGLTARDTTPIAERLAGFGLEAIEISGGIQEPKASYNSRTGINRPADEGYFLENARRFRDVTDLPLILVGGFRTPEVMERTVADEGMDFVSLCRPLINDPDLPMKWQAGSDERAGCISCNLCMRNRQEPLRCWYKYPAGAPQA
jgi:2,4-dienoyl-CoA reductase-like NADH-dependent reductase (Old Yellow Enzyme family)